MANKNLLDTPNDLLDQQISGCDPRTALDSSGLIGNVNKALAERMLNAEMDVHPAKESGADIANVARTVNARPRVSADDGTHGSIVFAFNYNSHYQRRYMLAETIFSNEFEIHSPE